MDPLFLSCFIALIAIHLAVTGCVGHVAWYMSRASPRLGAPWWLVFAGLLLVAARKVLIYWHVDADIPAVSADEYARVIFLPGASTLLFAMAGFMIFLRMRRLVRTKEGLAQCRELAERMFYETARIKKSSGAERVHDSKRDD